MLNKDCTGYWYVIISLSLSLFLYLFMRNISSEAQNYTFNVLRGDDDDDDVNDTLRSVSKSKRRKKCTLYDH